MALCFAHATAGFLAYEALRPPGPHRPGLMVAAVLLGNAPDLDFVPGLLIGSPGAFHRGLTHTILAVALVAAGGALLGARVGPWRPVRWRLALFAAVAYGSHLLVDWLTFDARPPLGGRFLWPLSDAYYLSPVTVLGEIIIDPSGRLPFFRSLVTPAALVAWSRELLVCAAALATLYGVRSLRATLAPAPRMSEER